MKRGGRKGYSAAHVMRYIFPKQFGMPNVFDTVHQKGIVVSALGNTLYREADIMVYVCFSIILAKQVFFGSYINWP